MNVHEIEIMLYMIAAFALSCVMVPRLLFFMELRRMNDATIRYLGSTAFMPKPVSSRQHMLDASRSVQKALSKRVGDFRWMIKVHEHRDSIEKAVRIEGFVPVDKLSELNEQHKKGAQQLDIKITVDIYQVDGGSTIVWKYMPNNSGEFQRRQQVFDPAVSFLLSHTNFSLMTELSHRV